MYTFFISLAAHLKAEKCCLMRTARICSQLSELIICIFNYLCLCVCMRTLFSRVEGAKGTVNECVCRQQQHVSLIATAYLNKREKNYIVNLKKSKLCPKRSYMLKTKIKNKDKTANTERRF